MEFAVNLPVRPADLLRARREEISPWWIDVAEERIQLFQWSVRSEKRGRGIVEATYSRSYLLPAPAVRLLNQLPLPIDPKGWVFPSLADKTPGERESLLDGVLSKYWSQYPAQASTLREMFQATASASRLFHPDLISEVIAGKFRPQEPLYDFSRYALAIWWSSRLTMVAPVI